MARHRILVSVLAATVAMVPVACSSGDDEPPETTAPASTTSTSEAPAATTLPAPLADQTAPTSINGLVVDGDSLWVASIDGDVVLRVDRTSGAILERHDAGGAGPDDVAVGPDGTVYSTGFVNGDVGRIVNGKYSVLVTLREGINPITVGADGTIWVGELTDGGVLTRITPDGKTETVATDVPIINGFAVDSDGRILAPAGGPTVGETGGSIVRIDPGDGSVTTVAEGLPAVMASTITADGRYLALANISGQVIEVDPENGSFEVIHTVTQGAPFDNIDAAPDGTLYLSSFTAPTITVVAPDGTISTIQIGQPA